MSWPDRDAARGGVEYKPDVCDGTYALIPMDCPAVSGSKSFTGVEATVSGGPFVVLTSYQCTPVGTTLAEAERRVRLRMQLREQRAVEERIWTGVASGLGTMASLFSTATVIGPASCPVQAMELLEQWLVDNDVLGGIIHMRPGMMPHMADHFQIELPSKSRTYKTHLGTSVVFGQGYAGTGPTGQATTTTTEWMYASGRVLVWRDSDVLVPPAPQVLDRSSNILYLTAERGYAVSIECGVAAIEVTRDCTT